MALSGCFLGRRARRSRSAVFRRSTSPVLSCIGRGFRVISGLRDREDKDEGVDDPDESLEEPELESDEEEDESESERDLRFLLGLLCPATLFVSVLRLLSLLGDFSYDLRRFD